MRPHHLSYAFLGSFLLTIFLLQWWQSKAYPEAVWFFLGNIGVTSIVALSIRHTRIPGALILATTIGIACAFFAVARTTHVPTIQTVDYYANDQPVAIRGVVANEPDKRPLKTNYTIEAEYIRAPDTQGWIPVSGRVLSTDHGQWPEYHYGDALLVRGKLERPGLIETFHYDRYLSRFGVESVMYFSALQKKGRGKHHPLLASLYRLKEQTETQINRLFPEPHASFLAGLLTGSRRGIPQHLLEDFNATGLTHIIAISGYNIAIVLSIIGSFFFFLPLKWRFLPLVGSTIAYTLFVGAEASVVRAAIMGILGLFALQTERQKDTWLAILWTASAMLLWNPKYLWYDAGFQLSFLAVIGLALFSPWIRPWLTRIPQIFSVREALEMTIAAQLAAAPWIAVLFGRVSFIAPVANALVALPVPLAMLFGAAGTFISFFWFPLGHLLAYLSWGFLEWVILVAEWLSAIPYASIELPNLPIAFVILYYVLLAFAFLLLFHKKKRAWFHQAQAPVLSSTGRST